ncbi:MAG: ATP phosphoribosyltransferase regulatory subunit [Alphaproteobacteria bacterium]|nr:MAG: ATP phosphoribosyltransferase regulatory subunit [Alphaproteobacteria bacterium]
MSDTPHPALLPTGIHDLLPPEAEAEADAVSRLMATLAAHGYERVEPPLVEFEETLFSGAGAAMATATFRMMDPISHRMIGVRADMTPQIARIAATRLGNAPRPLRLSYAGQVLRVKGSEIRPERQIGQVGGELIGAEGTAADIEAIAVAGEALAALGVSHLSVDITLPTLVPAIAEAYDIGGERAAALRAALDHKDAAAVAAIAGEAGELLEALLAAAGPVATTLAALDRLVLPARARAERIRLGAVLDGLTVAAPDLKVTVDPVENRGFEYHTGISFTFFAGGPSARGPLGELGRGGRYEAGDPATPEPATGFTLYTDTILRVLPEVISPRRVLLPLGADRARAGVLRRTGWVTVAALDPAGDWRAEARRLGCSHVLEGEAPVAVD